MKFFAATLSLLSLASAGPLQQRQSADNGSSADSPFVLNLRWSNSPLSGPINANGGSFWNGKPTASYCPDNIPGCKEVNTTSFVGRDGNLFLNTGVPGGQQGNASIYSLGYEKQKLTRVQSTSPPPDCSPTRSPTAPTSPRDP